MTAWTGEGAFALYGAAVGAVLGAGITWAEGGLRQRREKHARAKYLATRVVLAIDRFVASCGDALRADPHPLDEDVDPDTFAPFPNEYQEPTDVDWLSVEDKLAFDLLSIPGRDCEAREKIRALQQFDSGVRPLRNRLFGELALDANSLADRLREGYGVPPRAEDERETAEWLKELAADLEP